MNKPISIIIEETKQSIAEVLNESGLHPYVMETIMKDLYEEVHSVYIKTVQQEKAEYEKSLETTEE